MVFWHHDNLYLPPSWFRKQLIAQNETFPIKSSEILRTGWLFHCSNLRAGKALADNSRVLVHVRRWALAHKPLVGLEGPAETAGQISLKSLHGVCDRKERSHICELHTKKSAWTDEILDFWAENWSHLNLFACRFITTVPRSCPVFELEQKFLACGWISVWLSSFLIKRTKDWM